MKELLSRKFIYAMSVIIMGFSLVMVGKLEPQAFLSFAELIGGIYIAGNLGAKLIK